MFANWVCKIPKRLKVLKKPRISKVFFLRFKSSKRNWIEVTKIKLEVFCLQRRINSKLYTKTSNQLLVACQILLHLQNPNLLSVFAMNSRIQVPVNMATNANMTMSSEGVKILCRKATMSVCITTPQRVAKKVLKIVKTITLGLQTKEN